MQLNTHVFTPITFNLWKEDKTSIYLWVYFPVCNWLFSIVGRGHFVNVHSQWETTLLAVRSHKMISVLAWKCPGSLQTTMFYKIIINIPPAEDMYDICTYEMLIYLTAVVSVIQRRAVGLWALMETLGGTDIWANFSEMVDRIEMSLCRFWYINQYKREL